MVQPVTPDDSTNRLTPDAIRRMLIRTIDETRGRLIEFDPAADHIADVVRPLHVVLRELEQLKHVPSDEWIHRFGHYLSDDFRDEVTAHFHEAKRQALAEEAVANSQSADP